MKPFLHFNSVLFFHKYLNCIVVVGVFFIVLWYDDFTTTTSILCTLQRSKSFTHTIWHTDSVKLSVWSVLEYFFSSHFYFCWKTFNKIPNKTNKQKPKIFDNQKYKKAKENHNIYKWLNAEMKRKEFFKKIDPQKVFELGVRMFSRYKSIWKWFVCFVWAIKHVAMPQIIWFARLEIRKKASKMAIILTTTGGTEKKPVNVLEYASKKIRWLPNKNK